MAKRSLFNMVFGRETNEPKTSTSLQLLNGTKAQWTSFNGQLYDNSQIRSCIDAIARNAAKLSPKHIAYSENGIKEIRGRIYYLVSRRPNDIMNAYDFYYKVVSELYLNNNAFIYVQRNNNGTPIALYPLKASQYKLLEYNHEIYIQFVFNGGKKHTVPLKDDIIHLKRFYCEEDILGGNTVPITKTMSFKHVMNEGIINAIRTTQGIKGILKTTKAMLKPEDIKKTRDDFVRDFLNDGTGIGGLDATTDFKEVNISPQTATDTQVKLINDEILNYFGINEKVLKSEYSEDEWNAFYEGVIEPIAIQLSLEFTNKIFTIGERYHGNEIVFETNRLQYASNQTKISIIKEAGALGLLTINEGREILNLAPVEGGDVRLQSLNYTDIKEGE